MGFVACLDNSDTDFVLSFCMMAFSGGEKGISAVEESMALLLKARDEISEGLLEQVPGNVESVVCIESNLQTLLTVAISKKVPDYDVNPLLIEISTHKLRVLVQIAIEGDFGSDDDACYCNQGKDCPHRVTHWMLLYDAKLVASCCGQGPGGGTWQ